MMIKKVLILRGLPGSGKSTFAKTLNAYVVSADNYHMKDGRYCFDPNNIAKAHQQCLRSFTRCMLGPPNEYIIVDNTNTTAVEIAPYYRLAEAFWADVEILQFDCTVEESFLRNKHNVPLHIIEKMYKNISDTSGIPWTITHKK